mmetsp:Transcript_8349/g.12502  ORF Transcript_8349/g.12502 Transcript_8349/m.12502 type:complete len:281 (+) Transcript_8349:263-1105(+)
MERSGTCRHRHLSGSHPASLLQAYGRKLDKVIHRIVRYHPLPITRMEVKDRLIHGLQIVHDGPEEVSHLGSVSRMAKHDNGTVFRFIVHAHLLLHPHNILLMTHQPLTLIVDLSIDEIESNEQDPLEQKSKVLLSRQLTIDCWNCIKVLGGEVILEFIELIHPIFKGCLRHGAVVPIIIPRQDNDRHRTLLEQIRSIVIHRKGTQCHLCQIDVPEMNQKIPIPGMKLGQFPRQFCLIGLIVGNVTRYPELNFLPHIIIHGGSNAIAPTPQCPAQNAGQCH